MNSRSHHQSFDSTTKAELSGAYHGALDGNFDIFGWYPRYQNCQRYFLDYAQHCGPVQAVSAFLNIRLPFQQHPNPIFNSRSTLPTPTPLTAAAATTSTSMPPATSAAATAIPSSSSIPIPGQMPSTSPPPSSTPPPLLPPPSVSLIPYIRRLVATGMDFPGVLHGFFGDDWGTGIGPLHEQERRNYLFAAKSGGWASVKKDYDIPPQETIPFLRPLQGSSDAEIEAAESSWSEWLAMEDWMVGPRAPDISS